MYDFDALYKTLFQGNFCIYKHQLNYCNALYPKLKYLLNELKQQAAAGERSEPVHLLGGGRLWQPSLNNPAPTLAPPMHTLQ